MKNIWGIAILAGSFVAPGTVGSLEAFDVPRHVFEFAQLAEAQREAFDDEKPLLLLLADPKKEPT